jgi:outer membrane protein OmpA-like peptidoglycan-associated protein
MLVAAGCSDSGKAGKSDPPTAKAGAPTSSAPAAASGFTKEGWFGGPGGLHARLQITGVERQGAKSVLKYSVTSLDSAAKSAQLPIKLLDPVGGKLYKPTASTGGEQFAPGATRQMQAEYPAIPQNVQKLTAITPGTAGEYTGIPVTGTGDAPAAGAATGGNPVELYDITEGEIKDVTSSGTDVTMNLRTDVLFAFNSAKLSGRSKSVLDEAAQEIKAKADPNKRPLTFDGHTDSKGSDSYNLKLSRKRAEAVMNEMKKRLGNAFKYSAHGKGEAEPVAKEGGKDDAQARARNRRVDNSYVFRQQTAGTTGSSSAAAGGRGATVAPAAFHGQDGNTVASRYGRFGADKRRLDVKPFYRDGAYLVCVFTITDEGPGTTPPNANYAHKDYPGGAFTSFSVLAQGGKDIYRAVRIGPGDPGKPAAYVDPGRATFLTAANQPQRGVIDVPAPPGNIASVVFDGGPFGKVLNVPVS